MHPTLSLERKVLLACAMIASLLSLLIWTHGAHSQQTLEPPSPELLVERLRQDLSLSEEQVSAVEALLLATEQRKEEILASYGLSTEQMAALQNELRSEMDSFFAGVEALLSEEQLERFQRQRHGMGGHPPLPPGLQ